jgi:hypothetical protein
LDNLHNTLNSDSNSLIFEINGGIGNQIFQLANSYVFAIKTGRKILLDTRGCDSAKSFHASWHLDLLVKEMQRELPVSVVRSNSCVKVIKRKLRDKIQKPIVIPKNEIVDTYMLGTPFKHSDKCIYFPTLEDRFLAQEALALGFAKFFHKFSAVFEIKVDDYLNRIVGVHIRRSDSVTSNRFVPDDWFTKVLKEFENESTKFLCFTDSVEALTFLDKFKNVLIFGPNFNPLDSLIHLSLCDSLVLSRSTFSFWAAAISNSKDIIVPTTTEQSYLPLGSNIRLIDI